jgi:hypothetical protein
MTLQEQQLLLHRLAKKSAKKPGPSGKPSGKLMKLKLIVWQMSAVRNTSSSII